jgi:hypothetical protein
MRKSILICALLICVCITLALQVDRASIINRALIADSVYRNADTLFIPRSMLHKLERRNSGNSLRVLILKK